MFRRLTCKADSLDEPSNKPHKFNSHKNDPRKKALSSGILENNQKNDTKTGNLDTRDSKGDSRGELKGDSKNTVKSTGKLESNSESLEKTFKNDPQLEDSKDSPLLRTLDPARMTNVAFPAVTPPPPTNYEISDRYLQGMSRENFDIVLDICFADSPLPVPPPVPPKLPRMQPRRRTARCPLMMVPEKERIQAEKRREHEKQEREGRERRQKERERIHKERERRLKEREKRQKERQKELEREKRQKELEKNRQKELEKNRQIELKKNRQIELEKNRQIELEKNRQIELEKNRQIDLNKERSRQRLDIQPGEIPLHISQPLTGILSTKPNVTAKKKEVENIPHSVPISTSTSTEAPLSFFRVDDEIPIRKIPEYNPKQRLQSIEKAARNEERLLRELARHQSWRTLGSALDKPTRSKSERKYRREVMVGLLRNNTHVGFFRNRTHTRKRNEGEQGISKEEKVQESPQEEKIQGISKEEKARESDDPIESVQKDPIEEEEILNEPIEKFHDSQEYPKEERPRAPESLPIDLLIDDEGEVDSSEHDSPQADKLDMEGLRTRPTSDTGHSAVTFEAPPTLKALAKSGTSIPKCKTMPPLKVFTNSRNTSPISKSGTTSPIPKSENTSPLKVFPKSANTSPLKVFPKSGTTSLKTARESMHSIPTGEASKLELLRKELDASISQLLLHVPDVVTDDPHQRASVFARPESILSGSGRETTPPARLCLRTRAESPLTRPLLWDSGRSSRDSKERRDFERREKREIQKREKREKRDRADFEGDLDKDLKGEKMDIGSAEKDIQSGETEMRSGQKKIGSGEKEVGISETGSGDNDKVSGQKYSPHKDSPHSGKDLKFGLQKEAGKGIRNALGDTKALRKSSRQSIGMLSALSANLSSHSINKNSRPALLKPFVPLKLLQLEAPKRTSRLISQKLNDEIAERNRAFNDALMRSRQESMNAQPYLKRKRTFWLTLCGKRSVQKHNVYQLRRMRKEHPNAIAYGFDFAGQKIAAGDGILRLKSEKGIFRLKSEKGIFRLKSEKGIFRLKSEKGIFRLKSEKGIFRLKSEKGIFRLKSEKNKNLVRLQSQKSEKGLLRLKSERKHHNKKSGKDVKIEENLIEENQKGSQDVLKQSFSRLKSTHESQQKRLPKVSEGSTKLAMPTEKIELERRDLDASRNIRMERNKMKLESAFNVGNVSESLLSKQATSQRQRRQQELSLKLKRERNTESELEKKPEKEKQEENILPKKKLKDTTSLRESLKDNVRTPQNCYTPPLLNPLSDSKLNISPHTPQMLGTPAKIKPASNRGSFPSSTATPNAPGGFIQSAFTPRNPLDILLASRERINTPQSVFNQRYHTPRPPRVQLAPSSLELTIQGTVLYTKSPAQQSSSSGGAESRKSALLRAISLKKTKPMVTFASPVVPKELEDYSMSVLEDTPVDTPVTFGYRVDTSGLPVVQRTMSGKAVKKIKDEDRKFLILESANAELDRIATSSKKKPQKQSLETSYNIEKIRKLKGRNTLKLENMIKIKVLMEILHPAPKPSEIEVVVFTIAKEKLRNLNELNNLVIFRLLRIRQDINLNKVRLLLYFKNDALHPVLLKLCVDQKHKSKDDVTPTHFNDKALLFEYVMMKEKMYIKAEYEEDEE